MNDLGAKLETQCQLKAIEFRQKFNQTRKEHAKKQEQLQRALQAMETKENQAKDRNKREGKAAQKYMDEIIIPLKRKIQETQSEISTLQQKKKEKDEENKELRKKLAKLRQEYEDSVQESKFVDKPESNPQLHFNKLFEDHLGMKIQRKAQCDTIIFTNIDPSNLTREFHIIIENGRIPKLRSCTSITDPETIASLQCLLEDDFSQFLFISRSILLETISS